MLWILDASINISMEPFRAFVGDMLSSEQRTTGFAMQSFFIGVGVVMGSFFHGYWPTGSKVPEARRGRLIPLNVRLSFYIGAAVLLLSVLWTIIRTKNIHPPSSKSLRRAKG